MIQYYVTFDVDGEQTSYCTVENKFPLKTYHEAPAGFDPETEECELRDGFVYRVAQKVRTHVLDPDVENERKREFGQHVIDVFGGENMEMYKSGVITAADFPTLLNFLSSIQNYLLGGALGTAISAIEQFYAANPNYVWLSLERKNKYVTMLSEFLVDLK